MTSSIPQYIVIVFGAAICVACVWGIYSPSGLMTAVRTGWDKSWGMPAAVIVRLALGALLIYVAPETRFPVFFKVLGGMAMLAAILLLLVGKDRISRLMAWFERMPALGIRLWLLFGIAFGALLIYGVL